MYNLKFRQTINEIVVSLWPQGLRKVVINKGLKKDEKNSRYFVMTRSLKRSEISSGNEKRLECSQRWHEDTGWEAKCEIQFMLQLPLIWYHFSQITRGGVSFTPEKRIEFDC